jgi:alpha-tubulin suppressor-like RCC1 family protein
MDNGPVSRFFPGAILMTSRLSSAMVAVLLCLLSSSLAEAASAQAIVAGERFSCALTSAGGVQCWGSNSYGQLGDGTTANHLMPEDVTGLTGGVVSIAAGRAFVCALTVAGGVTCWGHNVEGQLGDGTAIDRTSPVSVSGLTSGVIALSTGHDHACALTSSGGVKCWGRNTEGQVGDSTNTARPTPVDVTGLASGVRSLSARGWHSCAVTVAGGVKCWGYNYYGNLGDGTTTNRSAPANVSGLTSGVVMVASGQHFNCALTTAGGIQCWGENTYGQIGDGSTDQRLVPVAATGLASGVVSLGEGFSHACAVLGTGALKCWGANASSQVGDGTTTDRSTATDVGGGLSRNVAMVAGGSDHTCALMANGAVRCWGSNAFGQIGDLTTTNRTTPVAVGGLAGVGAVATPGARAVSINGYHTCTVTSAGGVDCWGYNNSGQLGDATTTQRPTPRGVHGLSTGVTAVTVGFFHTCALTAAGGVKCWGENSDGQLGDGTTTDRLTPVDVVGLTSGVASVVAGRVHTCAVTTGGGVKCWGDNSTGGLGDGTTSDRSSPVNVTGLTSGVAAVAAGATHSCAVTTGGALRCWGGNASGQLGDGTTTDAATPVSVSGLGSGVAGVSAGDRITCALTTSGGVKCWGLNDAGQLGDGTTTVRFTPVDVSGLTSGVSSLDVGSYLTCARTTAGGLRCWGSNLAGGLGNGGASGSSSVPVDVVGLQSGVASVSVGMYAACAVTLRGGLQCWGNNGNGQSGDGTTTAHTSPGSVIGHLAGARLLSAGGFHTCRVTTAGGVQCWGDNASGQLGDGTTTVRRTPSDVVGLASSIGSVVAGYEHTCALTTTGGVKCWGANAYGQLGDGTTTDRSAPVDVAGLPTGVIALALGQFHSCALTVSNSVRCWGRNVAGQLGDGTTTIRLMPGWVAGLPPGIRAVTAGSNHTCALTSAGGVLCWGYNPSGALGDNTTTSRPTPVAMLGAATGVAAVEAGGGFTCVLTEAGGVKCVGFNGDGELGDGTTVSKYMLVDVVGLTTGVTDFAIGGYHGCATRAAGGVRCWGRNNDGQLGDGTTSNQLTPVGVPGLALDAGSLVAGFTHTCVATPSGGLKCWGDGTSAQLGDGMAIDRLGPVFVRGFRQQDNYDSDQKADVAVFRPSTGTWFSLNSSASNTTYQSRGWGVQAEGDVAVPGDYDGDGIVDPTVFRASTGTWFVLKSSSNFTAMDYFGWGTTGDTPVPADYDGDGKTDGAVFRAATGTWYIRPSSGAAPWQVTFGDPTDVPIPGHFDTDGKADIAVYRPSTGTWFVLTSASNYTDFWYRGWGIQAQGDSPAPGDYDGDGKVDLCVFRASTGSWFILESQYDFTTWRYFGWGANGDTLVPGDYDGDGLTDAAVYRPSTFTWYIRPSSGATQWSTLFGASGDVPLITIR